MRSVSHAEMIANASACLLNRRLGFRHAPERVEENEVMDHPTIANRCHVDGGLLQPASISLAFVAQRIILGGDDDGRRQALSSSVVALSGDT